MNSFIFQWPELVFDPAFMAHIDRLALKRFGQQGLAEEAASHVIAGLSANDWAACRHYQGRAQPRTFLLSLAVHLLEEFARQRFGRPRPPEWLKREGDLWVKVWVKICLERQLPQSVIESASQSERDPGFVAAIIRTIKARLPWCGESRREIPADCLCCDESDPADAALIDASIQERLSHVELEQTLLQLHRVFFSNDCPSTQSMNTEPESPWVKFRTQLALTAEELLLLRMVHQEGMKLTQIAKLLGMPSYQPGRLLKDLYQRIAIQLANCNIHIDTTALDANTAEHTLATREVNP